MNLAVPNLSRYATLVFDCDGVVLDSNRVKSSAFRTAALPWGTAAAEALVTYNAAHGGVSRYSKFAYFLETIVPRHATATSGPGLDALLKSYTNLTHLGLMVCPCSGGLSALRAATNGTRWLIVSGGDQAELRAVFAARGIAAFFDGGIFGSPDNKDAILARELGAGNISQPALFFGDSQYDHQVSRRAGLDFVFVSEWSEFDGWSAYVHTHELPVMPSLDWLAQKLFGRPPIGDAALTGLDNA